MRNQLAENVFWVGYVDWSIRDFHGYETTRGSSYNAYLILDDQPTLIDAVKAPYVGELLRHVAAHTPLASIRNVVCNHAEPDHSGGLPAVMAACPQATLICDEKCKMALERHYNTAGWNFRVVKTGDAISIGKRSLHFVETPMAHWPDSMATYLPEARILFSMDAFGQHYATSGRFDDEVPPGLALAEAKTYYANILMCYDRPVGNALKVVDSLAIDLIAPSHGVIWRSHIADILERYRAWVAFRVEPKVVVMYDTMWQSTASMARAIYEGVVEKEVECKLLYFRAAHITEIVTEMLDAAAAAVGSATLNQTLMPQAAAAMTYLMGLRPQNKRGFAFGSYGWGRGGAEAVQEYLEKMKFQLLRDPLKCQYVPDKQMLETCREAGHMLAGEAVKAWQESEARFGGNT